MVSIKYDGRLGNNLIQYLAAFFFAKKHNLKLNSSSEMWGNFFKENNINSGRIGSDFLEINDSNFIDFLEKKEVEDKHYYFNGFFQKKEFLQNNENKIKGLLNIGHTQINKDLVFLHYRIGDIQNDRRMLPVEYYEEALSNMNFNGGYISSDSINHKFCIHLIKKYNLIPINMNPSQVIDFGKNFNNIVLSEGTFSWWIGFLSQAETIICNKRDFFWHGDIFLDRWKKLSWDYTIETIFENYKLKEYKPKKN